MTDRSLDSDLAVADELLLCIARMIVVAVAVSFYDEFIGLMILLGLAVSMLNPLQGRLTR